MANTLKTLAPIKKFAIRNYDNDGFKNDGGCDEIIAFWYYMVLSQIRLEDIQAYQINNFWLQAGWYVYDNKERNERKDRSRTSGR